MMYVDNYLGALDGHTQASSSPYPLVVNGGWDSGHKRQFLDDNNRLCAIVYTGRWTTQKGVKVPIREKRRVIDLINNGDMSARDMVSNATALRKEQWIALDTEVVRASRLRTKAWSDLMSRNPYGGFNGFNKMILEHQVMSDAGEAIVDMSGNTPGRTDSPQFQLEGLPLPITHCDFNFDARRLAISRSGGTPLDTDMGEMAGARVGEKTEKMTLGMDTAVTYGGQSTQIGGYSRTPSVYGYLNFPQRTVKTNLHKPTNVGWTASQTLGDVLAMKDIMTLNRFYGPFVIYHSDDWDAYMDNDYTLTGGNVTTQTLRQRLMMIAGIQAVERLDFLTANVSASNRPERIKTTNPFTLLMVNLDRNTAQAVNGMDVTTLQWEVNGGMQINFKVMCIQVPRMKSNWYGESGIIQANASSS